MAQSLSPRHRLRPLPLPPLHPLAVVVTHNRTDDDIRDRLTAVLSGHMDDPAAWTIANRLLPVVRNLLNDTYEQGCDDEAESWIANP